MINSNSYKKILFCLIVFLTAGIKPCPAGADQDMFLGQDANLRAEPRIDSMIVHVLLKGTKVIKKEENRNWFRIYCPAIKQTGWINAGLLQKAESLESKEPAPVPYSKIVAFNSPGKSNNPLQADHYIISPPAVTLPPVALAVINLQQVIEKSKKGRAARRCFENLQKQNPGQDTAPAEQNLLAPIIMEIHLLVEDYARANRLTHVLNKNSGVLFHYDERFDITSEIIKLYDQQSPEKQ